MRRFFPQSFRSMLISLVLLSVLPALGVILYGGMASHEHAIKHAREELVRMVTALSGAQERTADLVRQTLVTLSIMDEVRNHDIEACAAIFTRIMLHNTLFTNIALTDRAGNILVSAVPMAFSSLADRKHFKDALRTKKFAPGEYIISRATAISSFPFAFPILDDQAEVSGVLTVALDLDKFHRFFANQHLPEGSFLGIADHQGRRIFRSFVDDSFPLGAQVSPGAWKAAQQGGESGTFLSTGSDGIERISAYYKLRMAQDAPAYMTIFIGMPEAAVGSDARRAMITGLTLFAFAAILALAMALASEGVIFKPRIRALLGAAERFRTGDYSVPTGVAHDAGELGLLAGALDRMAQERQVALDELRAAKEAAEDASRSKSEFLANMSHEIRTPLNGVLGMLQLLETTSPSAEQREYVETAIRSTDRLTRLLSDILDLSRIESNKLVIQEENFAVSEVCQSLLDIFGVPARDKGLSLQVRVDPRIPAHLFGDEARLRQILFNLVGNAIKFTRQGKVDVDFVLLSAAADSPCLIRCTVVDTGVGIPGERLKDIFEPFIQVEGSHIRTHQGAGLGLSIVRRLVDLMHGQLGIESTPGVGTSVAVTLPFERGAVPARARGAGAEENFGARRFLLVEDDSVNRMAMERILAKLGCTVLSAGNGQEALDVLGREAVDLVFMDVQMPVMDGLEATRIIRQELKLGVPIVAMTAYAMAGDRERFLGCGMDDYVSKPVDMARLRQVIAANLNRTR